MHLDSIYKMIDIFENKYKEGFEVSTSLLVKFLKLQYKLLEIKIYKIE